MEIDSEPILEAVGTHHRTLGEYQGITLHSVLLWSIECVKNQLWLSVHHRHFWIDVLSRNVKILTTVHSPSFLVWTIEDRVECY
jgi:hypothetical protein